ncbi:acyl-CoA-sterol O-acyltransferase 1 [Capsicum annuum]
MENYLQNPILVSFLLLLSLNYSYLIVSKFPKGIPRILALAPIFYLLYFFPWCFSLAFLRGILSLFITWMTSFKLILFCFNRGPLSICENTIDFILISILPLKISREVHQKYEISNEKSIEKIKDESISDGSPSKISNSSIYERYEMEEIFRQPYLATTFQDFWGRRWNRYASKMLRLTIYDPTNEALRKFLGKNTARILAIEFASLVKRSSKQRIG